MMRRVPVELVDAWRIHSLGIGITLDDYERTLPAMIRDDLVMIREVLDELRDEERERAESGFAGANRGTPKRRA